MKKFLALIGFLAPLCLFAGTEYNPFTTNTGPNYDLEGANVNNGVFNNASFPGGIPTTNLTGTLPAANLPPTVIVTNGALPFNSNSASSGILSQVMGLGHVIVCPYTNLPPSMLVQPNIFTPANGPNYVQLAVNSLPYPASSNLFQGGGEIEVFGNNFMPSSLILTTPGTPIGHGASYFIHSPSFMGGALISSNGNCVTCYSSNSNCKFFAENMTFSCLHDTTNTILSLGDQSPSAMSRIWVSHCCIAPWAFVASNAVFGTDSSFSPEDSQWGNWGGNLVGINITAHATDDILIEGNSIEYCAVGLIWNGDHGIVKDNFFTSCGNYAGTTNQLCPNTSPISLGVDIILNAGLTAENNDVHFLDNHHYECNYGFYITSNLNNVALYGYEQMDENCIIENDTYECGGSPGGYLLDTNAGATVIHCFMDEGRTRDPTYQLVTKTPGGVYGYGTIIPPGQVPTHHFDYGVVSFIGPKFGLQVCPANIYRGGTFWYDGSGYGLTNNILSEGTVQAATNLDFDGTFTHAGTNAAAGQVLMATDASGHAAFAPVPSPPTYSNSTNLVLVDGFGFTNTIAIGRIPLNYRLWLVCVTNDTGANGSGFIAGTQTDATLLQVPNFEENGSSPEFLVWFDSTKAYIKYNGDSGAAMATRTPYGYRGNPFLSFNNFHLLFQWQ